jgi:mono/diheme cytochrome c family protein
MTNKWVLIAVVTLLGTLAGGDVRAQSAGQWKGPQQIYGTICQYCHLTNVGPVLFGRQLPATYTVALVRSGRNGMPAFRPSEMSNAELLALGQWLEQSQPDTKP